MTRLPAVPVYHFQSIDTRRISNTRPNHLQCIKTAGSAIVSEDRNCRYWITIGHIDGQHVVEIITTLKAERHNTACSVSRRDLYSRRILE